MAKLYRHWYQSDQLILPYLRWFFNGCFIVSFLSLRCLRTLRILFSVEDSWQWRYIVIYHNTSPLKYSSNGFNYSFWEWSLATVRDGSAEWRMSSCQFLFITTFFGKLRFELWSESEKLKLVVTSFFSRHFTVAIDLAANRCKCRHHGPSAIVAFCRSEYSFEFHLF